MELKKQVVSGFFWTAAEKFSSLFVHLCAQVMLLRLLVPEDFGLLAMLAVFTAVSSSIVDSGFSQALIQKKKAEDIDYDSIFWLNLALAGALYLIMFFSAGAIARFFDAPVLARIAPWVFLTLPLSALGLIPNTILTRNMDFRKISKANFAASLSAAVAVVALAYTGFGVWALVGQTIVLYGVRTTVLWASTMWRPAARFSMASVRGLFGLGSRFFAIGLITQLFNNLSLAIIGKFYSAGMLGFYERALKLRNSAADAISLPVQNVTFPAFASLQDEEAKFVLAGRQVIAVLSFILFPVMSGLIAIAPEGFMIAGQEKWMPAVPYFRILCLSAFCIPLSNISLNMLKAKGRGDTLLKIEVIKKAVGFAFIIYGATVSVMAVAWAYLAWTAFEMIVNLNRANHTVGYPLRQQAADTLPYLALSAAMFACVMGTERLLAGSSVYLLLGAKTAVGAAVYIALSWLLKPAAWNETRQLVRSRLRGKAGA